ncbi:LacI family DNA-binding transcriptional regulator [Granulosicoccus sp. 3-233]|uniref:LacI family DNA-binding transcriptional regulator n=1 Tax=Granulosicoccus sp. 3-233 TaxID=3417969 RepID=UPI003D34BA8C
MLGDQHAGFQQPIVACLNRHLAKAGFDLIYVCGGSLKPAADWDENEKITRNAIYPLVRNFPVAGFVILTASIGEHANARALAHFVRQFSHRPVVCYGSSVPRIASVQIDYYTMMGRLMEYMTADPRRKRFVFLRGAPENPRSLTQERAFRDALTHRQLPVVEELFVNGNFQATDAYKAMKRLLQHTCEFDAVIAASDDMAQAAIHALASHGLRVPEDVIVSGFHNTLAASSSLTPITTVHCTEDSMSALVTASLRSQIVSGEYISDNSRVLHPPARLIIRASTESPEDSEPVIAASHAFDAVKFRAALLHSMSSLRHPAELLAEDIIDDIVSMLVNGTPFTGSRLALALKAMQLQPSDTYWWRHMHRQITANLERHGSEGQSSDALSRAAVILGKIHETIWNVECSASVRKERHKDISQRFKASLTRVSCQRGLVAALDELSEHCNSEGAFLCLYENVGEQPDEFARVIFQRKRGTRSETQSDRFRSADLLPGDFLHSGFTGPLLLEPLCIGNTHLGFLVLDLSGDEFCDQALVTELSDYLCCAIWRLQHEGRSTPSPLPDMP